MEKIVYHCEVCTNVATSIEQLRKENWLRIDGELVRGGVHVWLDKPRKKGGGFMITVGYANRPYDFCSIDCFVKALKGQESI